MPKYKPVIEVKKEDTALYNVMKGLTKKREYLIDNYTPEKQDILIKIGRQSEKLLQDNILDYPLIWHTANRKNQDKRLIRLPPNVKLEEIPGEKIITFHFKRRQII